MLCFLKHFLGKGRLVFWDDQKSGRMFAFIPMEDKRKGSSSSAEVTHNIFCSPKDQLNKAEQCLLRDYPDDVFPLVSVG